jgi:hypothetical protein
MPNGKQRDAIRTQALNFLLEVPKGTGPGILAARHPAKEAAFAHPCTNS